MKRGSTIEKETERHNWLLEKAKEIGHVDILNEAFVQAYIDKFHPTYEIRMWGANKCLQLARDLSVMEQSNRMNRTRIGLSKGAWQPGFPKWVWSYSPNL